MNPRLAWFLLSTVILLCACRTGSDLTGSDLALKDPREAAEEAFELARKTRERIEEAHTNACSPSRWIAVKRDLQAVCPAVEGWTTRPLFEEAPEDAEPRYPKPQAGSTEAEENRKKPADPEGPEWSDSAEVPPALRSFCVYERPDSDRDRDRSRVRGPRHPEIATAARDCRAVGAAADYPPPALLAGLEEHFLAQAGKAKGVPGRSSTDAAGPSPRLAFLDTQPTGEGVPNRPGYSAHGYSLVHLARSLACASGQDEGGGQHCAVQLATELALPYRVVGGVPERAPEDEGGDHGTISDLAQAIHHQLERWQAAPNLVPLVLNLSLGWDGEVFGGLDGGVKSCADVEELQGSEMRPPALAVYCALQVAACRGALVIAAAGNRSYGPQYRNACSQGPLLPAAWEEVLSAPDAETCVEILGVQPDRNLIPGRPDAEPLLYAVGAVQGDGLPLANSRPGGEPPRVAYGDHALVRDLTGRPTMTLTGTSVASTVVATAAAMLWKDNPGRSRWDLMELLYAKGQQLPRKADFAHPEEAFAVRWISLCQALDSDCEGPVPGLGIGRPQLAPSLARFVPAPGFVIDASSLTAEAAVPAECTSAVKFYSGSQPSFRCPEDRLSNHSSQVWVKPQPDDMPCPECGAFSRTPCVLMIDIPATWKSELHDASLNIDGKVYALGELGGDLQPIVPPKTFKIKDIPGCDGLSEVTSMTLSFRVEDGAKDYSVVAPVLLTD